MMDSTILSTVTELMEKAPVCILTTLDKSGQPSTRAVFNLRNREQFPEFIPFYEGPDDELPVYIGTNTSSVKIQQIQDNPAMNVYYCLPDTIHGIMVSGHAVILDDRDLKHRIWLDSWTMYYPSGPDDPDYTILSMKPSFLRGWFRGIRIDQSLETV